MQNKSEFGFWLRDVRRAWSQVGGKKSAKAYLEGIAQNDLGLSDPVSDMLKVKQASVRKVEEPGELDSGRAPSF